MLAITLKTIKDGIADAFATIRWKTIIIYFTIFIFILGFISITVGNIVSDFLSSERTADQSKINQQFSITIIPHILHNNSNALYDACVDSGSQFSGRFLVVDANAVVIADSFSEYNGTKLFGKEISSVLEDGEDSAYEFYKFTEGGNTFNLVNYACAIKNTDGSLIGASVYITSFQDVVEKIREIYIVIWTIAIIASVAVFILCLVS